MNTMRSFLGFSQSLCISECAFEADFSPMNPSISGLEFGIGYLVF